MPFADYADHKDCVSKNHDKADPDAYCATIERKVKEGKKVVEAEQLDERRWVITKGGTIDDTSLPIVLITPDGETMEMAPLRELT